MWDECVVTGDVSLDVARIIKNKYRYVRVSQKTGVPWYVIAVIHMREAGCDFNSVLHNGEKIIGTDRKTTLVPKGRGPFATWEDAAEDALRHDGLTIMKDWSTGNTLKVLEIYNGTGYLKYHKDIFSPYLWSKTNFYAKGKYSHDGKYDSELVDKQSGCVAVLKMLDLKEETRLA